jgi:chemotaxis protein MotB
LTTEADARKASIAELTALLSKSRDQTTALTSEVEAADRRTALAQEKIKERDIRLEELLSNYNLSLDQLNDEQRISAAAQQEVALLNRQLLAIRQQIASLQQALEASEAETAAQNVKILDLGSRLNKALASKVQELARFRSEFFGRLREVLKNRQDIRVVGDRFVFQSEVLFESASATIAGDGESELQRLALALNEIAPKIPENINWILQVEGHTDSIPIFNEQFRSNWDLSAARAISVVQFLIREGVPAERLSATGYGEFQPIDQRKDRIGNRRNRRIEMKLTQR